MKISYNWLKQFIKTDWPAEKTGELLTDLGLEVEGIDEFESVKGGLKGILVGHVLTCDPHPNADRLKITKVDIGEKEPLQIVCGAPNVKKGQKVPVATIGTVLFDENGEPWKIKKGKIRGEESCGMICAEDELGLGKSHDGILVLDKKHKAGTLLNTIFEVETDQIFEIGLTPNRADAMSHWGVARDLKAGMAQKKLNGSLATPSVSNFHVENRSNRIAIEVKKPNLAPRYCGLTVSGIKIAPSPMWLQNRLKAIGIAPKNNVVDATNYVMHELGQPLHAFDADKITGKKIIVQTLPKGTKFTTLDEVERKLDENDLMICDAEKPLCIAGVFGGLNSGVTENTSSVFLESAYFNPVNVRKTAKRHGLNTDASFRFERGVDPNITDYALKRAALLIQETAGGDVTSDLDDFYPKKIEDFQVFLTYEKINKLIGQNLAENTIKSILASLEIRVNNVSESGMGMTIPAYRVDVQREIDVIEEILRVYGYNNVAFSKKLNASIANSTKFENHKLQNLVANQLTSQGFYEIMANSLVPENHLELDTSLEKKNSIRIKNPLSQDLAIMRQSMLFSGLEAISHNLNRKSENLKFFEFGKTYQLSNSETVEKKHLSIFVTGDRAQENWGTATKKSDFFYLKGTLVSILERLGIHNLEFSSSENPIFSESLKIIAHKQFLGEFGVIKKANLKHFGIEQPVLFADFEWDQILETTKKQKIKFTPIPKFPSVRRDFALLLDDSVKFEAIQEIARQNGKKLLKDVNLFDVYQGENLPKGKKSYAVSFTFLDENKTLTDNQVDKIMKKLQTEFENKLNASLR
ncbi:MAG TPA: phenylalanine--tRNA ligase subunit beta [Flavobacteriaceae bacterium]|nr:phenylalanine--tRNA ligase subunit beta [Flavobacteriaceae bacterium]